MFIGRKIEHFITIVQNSQVAEKVYGLSLYFLSKVCGVSLQNSKCAFR